MLEEKLSNSVTMRLSEFTKHQIRESLESIKEDIRRRESI